MSTSTLSEVAHSEHHARVAFESRMLDQLPAAIYATDTQGRLTYYNEAAVRFSGRRPELGTDKWCISWKLYHADGTPMAHEDCPMAVTLKQQREVTGIEAIAERPDGTRVPFMPYPSLLRDERGRVVGAINMLVELTEAKLAKQALRASEERYHRLLAMLPAAVYTCDAPSGEITYYNERAAELWGRRPKLGTPDDRFCGSYRLWRPDGTRLAHSDTPMAAALRAGVESRNLDVVIERPDGSRVSVLVNIDPIRDADGRVVGAVNVFIDTTKLKEVERELVRRTRQLASFLETAVVGLHRVGPDGTILWVNDAELAMLGYERSEYVGRHISEFHVDPPVLDDILHRLRSGETLRDYEARLRAKDGTIRTVHIDSSIYREDGRFVHTQCFTRDVTERRQNEEAMAGLAALVDSSEDAIVGVTLEGIIASWNRAAERIYGHTAEEAVGRPIALIVPDERMDEEAGVLERLCRGERIESFETERLRKDGARVPISLTASAIRDRSGRIIGVSKIGRDITERKAAEAALREADRRKDEFLASLAHELRNPLAPIRTGLQLLRLSTETPGSARQTLEIMERQLAQLVRLIDDLLDISRISTGKVALKQERLELQAVLLGAVDMVLPLAGERDQRIETALPQAAVYLTGDPVRLTQVFSNLLNNALKFSPPGSAVRLRAEAGDQAVVVHVTDSGIGIPPALLARVFDPFVQLDATRPAHNTGLGIGLTLVRRFVELHGGRVEAKSDGPGTGSTFSVHLPPLAHAQDAQTAATEAVPAPVQRRRILIVDDNRDAVTSLAELLRIAGHEVHLAYDGMQALATVQRVAPEYVILDIGMPDMSGYEVCARIKRSARVRPTVIALTGWGQRADRQRSADAGFDEHLVKPVDFDVLARVLATGASSCRAGHATR